MNEHFYIYRLLHLKGFGEKGLSRLLLWVKGRGFSVKDIFTMSQKELHEQIPLFAKGRYASIQKSDFDATESVWEEYEALVKDGANMLTILDEAYPNLLRARLGDAAPPVLFFKGNWRLAGMKSISVVGSRGVSEKEVMFTKELAKSLTAEGYNIVSGYAKGVDTAAHIGALSGDGTTTAVLSMGIKHLSIKRDFRQYDWKRNTLFLSQFLPKQSWNARFAMQRNKIVCGLSDAVIVIASGPERDAKGRMSGTFAAAKFALQRGIPLLVLEPAFLEIAAKGNTQLISRGGMSFSSFQDILAVLSETTSDLVPQRSSHQLSLFTPE